MAQRNAMPSHGGATGSPLPQRICLLVLGMHRSGTSAMTRVISLLGADLPKTLLGEGHGNEAERLALLLAHRDVVERQLAEVTSHLRAIDHKIAIYENAVSPTP